MGGCAHESHEWECTAKGCLIPTHDGQGSTFWALRRRGSLERERSRRRRCGSGGSCWTCRGTVLHGKVHRDGMEISSLRKPHWRLSRSGGFYNMARARGRSHICASSQGRADTRTDIAGFLRLRLQKVVKNAPEYFNGSANYSTSPSLERIVPSQMT